MKLSDRLSCFLIVLLALLRFPALVIAHLRLSYHVQSVWNVLPDFSIPDRRARYRDYYRRACGTPLRTELEHLEFLWAEWQFQIEKPRAELAFRRMEQFIRAAKPECVTPAVVEVMNKLAETRRTLILKGAL